MEKLHIYVKSLELVKEVYNLITQNSALYKDIALRVVNLVHNIKTEQLQESYLILAKQISAFAKTFTT